MTKHIAYILGLTGLTLSLAANLAWTDESASYNQKTLPNGDTETDYSSSDGTKVVSIQHKDGTIETTSTSADGTKAVIIQHPDGTSESHVTQPNKTN